VLVSLFRVNSTDVGAAVVGNLLGVDPADLVLSGGLAVALVLLYGPLYQPLVLVTFDRSAARVLGLPVAFLDLLMLGAVATTAIVGAKVLGVILTVGVLVTPAATARLRAQRMPSIMLTGGLLGMFSGVIGL
jgi:ABC-type Mn2+/Zn2+ transport system permease subunit